MAHNFDINIERGALSRILLLIKFGMHDKYSVRRGIWGQRKICSRAKENNGEFWSSWSAAGRTDFSQQWGIEVRAIMWQSLCVQLTFRDVHKKLKKNFLNPLFPDFPYSITFAKFPGFERLSFWWEQHADKISMDHGWNDPNTETPKYSEKKTS
jgi:hypothetical protein